MKSSDDRLALEPLIELAHRRWNIPVLAELHRRSGARFVVLASTLGASRGSLASSLDSLVDMGLIRRNPGVGHPMRPEYLLTERGERVGAHCLKIARLVDRRGENDLAYRKWTLPITAAIGDGVRRFNEVRGLLGDSASPRAVTLGLKSLLSTGWAERLLIDDYPPAAGYVLARPGKSVLRQVDGIIAGR